MTLSATGFRAAVGSGCPVQGRRVQPLRLSRGSARRAVVARTTDIISFMHKGGAPFPTLSEASRSVLVDLLVHGPLSRAELARRAGLSPASLTRINRSFVDAGVVSESDTTSPQRTGRPSQPMDVNVNLAHL